MTKKHKHQHTGGEVTELARETAKVEQYWIVGDRSEPRKPPKNYDYVEELINLQIELIKFQEYVRHNGLKMCALFEGRDAAGKGGVIKRIGGVVRVPRRVFQRLLPERPTPERCVEAYYLQWTRFETIAERKLRRR